MYLPSTLWILILDMDIQKTFFLVCFQYSLLIMEIDTFIDSFADLIR